MSRGARAVARLLAGAPATTVNLDDLDADWRPLAEVLLDAPDRGAALETALAQRADGQQRWAELLAADALAPESEHQDHPKRFRLGRGHRRPMARPVPRRRRQPPQLLPRQEGPRRSQTRDRPGARPTVDL